uniref:Uncharacterized protein n=1 Tax=Cacopsylla melanoneura TaxID=428564 RepID=A0A8D9AWA1_9HEMI
MFTKDGADRGRRQEVPPPLPYLTRQRWAARKSNLVFLTKLLISPQDKAQRKTVGNIFFSFVRLGQLPHITLYATSTSLAYSFSSLGTTDLFYPTATKVLLTVFVHYKSFRHVSPNLSFNTKSHVTNLLIITTLS